MSNTDIKIKDIIKQEYAKCLKDPAYFIKNFCYIQHPTKGKILFTLYEFQENVLAALIKYSRVIILKNRQMGLSTLAAARALHLMTFYNDKNILVIATKQDVAKNIITKIRIMHRYLPTWLKRKCVEDNKLGLVYDNGSRVYATTSAGDSGRSEAVSLLIVDEAAFIPSMDNLWGALQPTLSTGGDVIVLSTPNGVSNWFYSTFSKAEEGKNNFYSITLHWSAHPERDINWRKAQDIELGPRLAKQECDATFLTSGDTVIDGEILEWYRNKYILDPIEITGFDRNVWIWQYPSYEKSYILAADVARGDGKDYSTFQVLDLDTLEQVAEYQGKISTRQFADLCIEYGTKYNDALLVIENASVGWDVIQRVIDRNYTNIYYNEISNDVIDDKTITKYNSNLNKIQKKSVPGFTTSNKTRPQIISKMEGYFNERSVIIRSKRLLNELLTFIWNSGRPEAASSFNDDLVMSYAIAVWVRDTGIRLKQKTENLTKVMLDSIQIKNTENHVNTNNIHLINSVDVNSYKIKYNNIDDLDLREFI